MILRISKYYLLILFLVKSMIVFSQELVSVNELLEDTTYADKLPIPIAAISINLDQTREVLDAVEERMELTPEQLNKIDSIISSLNVELTNYKAQITDAFINSSNTILLDKTVSDIKLINDRVNEYRDIVQEEISIKESEKEHVEKLLEIWEVSYKAERSTSLSNTVKENINRLITRIKDTNEKINNYLNTILELELELNQIHADFEALLKKVNEAKEEASKNLLIPDSNPIWVMYSTKRDTVSFDLIIEDIIELQKADAIEYYRYNKLNIFFGIFIIILIQIIFFVLRFRVLNEQIEDPEQSDNTVLKLLKKPFSPALLVGIFLFHTILIDKPFIINEIIYLIGIFPFTIVLIRILQKRKVFYIIYLAVILIISVISELVYDFEIISRSFMLLITILTVSLMIMILISPNFLADRLKLRNSVRVVTKFSLVFLVICLIGNITGNYTLTSILLYGFLSSIFAGILIYLLYLIIIGLFRSVFNSQWGQSFRIIKKYQSVIEQKIRRFVVFVLSVSFIAITFEGFRILDAFYQGIEKFLTTEYTLGNFTFTTNDILLFILILIFTGWISRFVQFVLEEQVMLRSKKQKDLSASISSLVKFGIITIGFFIAALASGFPLDKMALLISAFGVGIGFGLQNIFNNLVSGIILVFEQPLQVGDTIEVGNLLGVVKAIGIRASTIRTFDGSEVIVPNGNLISKELINWTHSDSQRRLIIKVGVAYGTDPNEVIKILMEVAKKKEGLLDQPEPYVLFKEFGDSALSFELRCYTESNDWLFILSDLHVEVNNALNDAGVVIPFPQRDLHIKSMDAGIVKSVKSPGRSK